MPLLLTLCHCTASPQAALGGSQEVGRAGGAQGPQGQHPGVAQWPQAAGQVQGDLGPTKEGKCQWHPVVQGIFLITQTSLQNDCLKSSK